MFLQEIISDEIVDETDQYTDNCSKKRARQNTSVRSKKRACQNTSVRTQNGWVLWTYQPNLLIGSRIVEIIPLVMEISSITEMTALIDKMQDRSAFRDLLIQVYGHFVSLQTGSRLPVSNWVKSKRYLTAVGQAVLRKSRMGSNLFFSSAVLV